MIFIFSTFVLCVTIAAGGAFRLGSLECDVDPQPAAMSQLKCTSEMCQVTCFEGYRFPHGETQLDLLCVNRQRWVAENYNEVPQCMSVCSPSCLNDGECINNQCYCREGFTGNRCQTHVDACPEKVPMPQNSMGRCITSTIQSCKVTCIQGHKFPDGSLSADLKCHGGQWVMQPRHFERCEPYCNPPCKHGGTCIAPNLCQCSADYRGNNCQHSTKNCSPQKIGFNGLYKCTGNHEKMECTISCPQGYDPTYTPHSKYTCKYAEGFFTPQQVPQCDYRGANVQIIHS